MIVWILGVLAIVAVLVAVLVTTSKKSGSGSLRSGSNFVTLGVNGATVTSSGSGVTFKKIDTIKNLNFYTISDTQEKYYLINDNGSVRTTSSISKKDTMDTGIPAEGVWFIAESQGKTAVGHISANSISFLSISGTALVMSGTPFPWTVTM
jgi:hypothetical protein